MKNQDEGFTRLLAQEELILEATEALTRTLSEQDVSIQDLALRSGKSQVQVTRMLAGERDMSLRDLADFAAALGYRFRMNLEEATPQEER